MESAVGGEAGVSGADCFGAIGAGAAVSAGAEDGGGRSVSDGALEKSFLSMLSMSRDEFLHVHKFSSITNAVPFLGVGMKKAALLS
jgi:hypothetical protein